jgi:energy-coupling factor transporter ATP-binding protein EcfA2
MISLSKIRYRYSRAPAPWVLQGVDLTIREGDYILICGRSGSGKSTFGYLLNGLIPHFFEGTFEGTVSICGQDSRDLTVADLLSSVGLVFQDADAQLFNSTVESEIAFGLESLGIDPKEIDAKIERTADNLAIAHLLDRSPMSLSGGEKRLVAIASVLCLDPPVIVLDEPLGHLDREGTETVREVLRNLHRRGTTLVVIEQRMSRVFEDVNRCVVLDQGKILFDGLPAAAGAMLDEQHLVPHYPQKRTAGAKPGGPILRIEHVGCTLEDNVLLEDVSLAVMEREILAIVGKNGAGKTTLIKHFNGLLRSKEGVVLYRDKNIRGRAPSEMAASVGISFQNPNDQFFKSTVRDEIMVGVRQGVKDGGQWIDELYSLFDLHELLDLSPYRLSEGQKKRVAIASVLVAKPEVLVLDEPTVGQDGHFLETLAGLLVSLRERGFTIVIVTHDLEFAEAIADRLILVHEGKVADEATPGTAAGDALLANMGLCERESPVSSQGAAGHAG